MNERVNESISRSIFNATRTSNGLNKIGTFRLDYEYEIEYEYDFSILVFGLQIVTTHTHFIS